jgi:hypothetical protein
VSMGVKFWDPMQPPPRGGSWKYAPLCIAKAANDCTGGVAYGAYCMGRSVWGVLYGA